MLKNKKALVGVSFVGAITKASVIFVSLLLMKLINAITEKNPTGLKETSIQLIVVMVVQVLSFGVYNLYKNRYINNQMARLKENVYGHFLKKISTTMYPIFLKISRC